MSLFATLFVCLLLALATNYIIFCQTTSNMLCIENERQALLELKKDLIDFSGRLSSWAYEGDCCVWAGIVCNNTTGHVSQLHLQNSLAVGDTDADYKVYEKLMLGGKINRSLLKLAHLFHLDLSGNNFTGNQIPSFLGFITTLRYLNLSYCEFSGRIPPQIGNLTNLQFLDLGQKYYLGLYAENLQWLANLSSLEYLDLSYVNLSKAFDWLQVTSNALPILSQLHLSDCELQHIPSVSPINFSSLSVLDLSDNSIDNISIPLWIFSLNNLVFISLSGNRFKGPIPDAFHNLTSLKHLDLSQNNFSSSIPNWLYSFRSLEYLNLGHNSFQGKVSNSIANLTKLNTLDLSFNYFQVDGEFLKSLENLCNLRWIGLSGIKLNQTLASVFQCFSTCISSKLEILDLAYSQLFGQLEDLHLESFRNLVELKLSGNSIHGTIPISIGQLSSLKYIDLSYNSFIGIVSESHFNNLTKLRFFWASGNQLSFSVDSNWIPPFQLHILSIGSWNLGPQFPLWLRSQKYLNYINLSSSGISDTIPVWFRNFSQLLQYIDLSSNEIKGHLPYVSSNTYGMNLFNNSLSGSMSHLLCHQMNETMQMEVLKLGNNFLSGEMPDCWTNWKLLNVIELSNNNLAGTIPNSIGDLQSLQSLHLRNNRFSGKVPLSLSGCKELMNIDFAENQFEGEFPALIGENLHNLVILNLRSNKFHGVVPKEICQLSSLRILDMANNNFSGLIPNCIHNFTAMITVNYSENGYTKAACFMEVALIMIKGALLEYSSTLKFLRIIDMSYNNLSGNIPEEITRLEQLQSLNLSHNFLTGKIPQDIGAMKSLESLDLRENQLSGKIPQSTSNLNFLSRLNLSNNNLEGQIPTGTQLQSFNASSFSGNRLCGPPFTKSCNDSVEIDGTEDEGNSTNEGLEVKWFYMGSAYGFAVGFWIVVGSLIIFRKWRNFYFQLLDRMWLRVRFGCV